MSRTLFVLLAALLSLHVRDARAGAGGPDAFGYSWSDQNEPGTDLSLPTPSAGPFPLVLGEDEVSAPIALGFTFPYYGQAYSELVLSSNGWFSFDRSLTDPAPAPAPLPFPGSPEAVVAWYWRDLSAPRTLEYWTAPGAILFHVLTKPTTSRGYQVEIRFALYQSGVIKIRYDRVDQPQTAVVGIENQSGDTGLMPWYLGGGQQGFDLAAGSLLELFPPPSLDCAAPGAITCGQTLRFSSPASVSPNVTRYGCSARDYLGREAVIRFSNPGFADVSVAISNFQGNTQFDAFLLRDGGCNEHLCQAGGGDAFQLPILPPGDYVIVVDGPGAGDNGNFDLSVACTPKGTTLPCQPFGAPPVAGQTSGASNWSVYPACATPSLFGPEFVYAVPLSAPGNLRAELDHDPSLDLDLLVFGPDRFEAPAGCLGWGDRSLSLYGLAAGTYYVMVEGRAGSTAGGAGAFQLSLTCEPRLDCSAITADLACSIATAGSTAGSPARVPEYSCSRDPMSGGEAVHRFHNDRLRDVSFVLGGTPGLTLQLLPAVCDEGGCLKQGDDRLVYRALPPGDYFVVVDGRNGAAGPYTLTPLCSTYVDPASGSWTLDDGEVVHETKQLFVNAVVPHADIMFIMDLTASMSGPLGQLNATTNAVIDAVAAAATDVRFGLASFQDYPGAYAGACGYFDIYGDTSDEPYKLELPITANRNQLGLSIASLQLGNGSDPPEASARAWSEMVDDAVNIGWRAGAPAIAVMIGDNLPHDCDTSACGVARAPTGTDPGRDGLVGTGDDIAIAATMMKLKASRITPLVLETSGVPSRLQQWECWSALAGGAAFSAPGGTLPAAALSRIQELIGAANSFTCQLLEVRPSPGFESWISGLTPVAGPVTLPAALVFDFDLGPPPGTADGTYTFTVDFLCDGVKLVAQDVTIEVRSPCIDPVGSVGNHLRAVRQASDVSLDWRGGALTPQSYNLHGENAKTLLSPPSSPPFGSVAGSETHLDPGAVALPPTLRFYQVYGRSCAGNSIFN